MTHLSEEELILMYYAEPGAAAGAAAHLVACSECREALAALTRTLQACDEWTVPEPDAVFERSVWAGIAPRLEERAGARESRLWPRWVVVPVLAAMLVAAFLAGRATRPQPQAAYATRALSGQARERILAIAVADHLDRAGVLLTEISHDGGGGFGDEKGRAQEIVEESRLMRQTLSAGGSANGTVALLDEVERLMLEIANAPDRVPEEEIRGWRQRIGSDSLLFKVRIIESNLRRQGQES